MIITFLELAIDLNVFDVKDGVVVEALFETPRITILNAMLILFSRCLLTFDLFL